MIEVLSCDELIAEIASRQHGTISTEQMLAVGITREEIKVRVRTGRLHRLHRGVYAVGHRALPPLGREAAAVLACGEGVVLSHQTAAALWGLLDKPPVVHVTVPKQRRHRDRIQVHRSRIERSETSVRDGLPLTNPQRTLRDLSRQAALGASTLERAAAEALYRKLITDDDLRTIPRLHQEPGSRHDAERILARLIAKAGLPEPLRNQRRHGWELDFFWPHAGFNLELDGFQAHGHRVHFERDRRRDADLRTKGIETLRVTWRMLDREAERLLVTLAKAVG